MKGSELKKLIIFMSQKFSYLDEKKYFSISIGAKNNDEMIRARIVISFLFLSKLNGSYTKKLEDYITVSSPIHTLNDLYRFRKNSSNFGLKSKNDIFSIPQLVNDFKEFKNIIKNKSPIIKLYKESRSIKKIKGNYTHQEIFVTLNTSMDKLYFDENGLLFLTYILCSFYPLFSMENFIKNKSNFHRDNFVVFIILSLKYLLIIDTAYLSEKNEDYNSLKKYYKKTRTGKPAIYSKEYVQPKNSLLELDDCLKQTINKIISEYNKYIGTAYHVLTENLTLLKPKGYIENTFTLNYKDFDLHNEFVKFINKNCSIFKKNNYSELENTLNTILSIYTIKLISFEDINFSIFDELYTIYPKSYLLNLSYLDLKKVFIDTKKIISNVEPIIELFKDKSTPNNWLTVEINVYHEILNMHIELLKKLSAFTKENINTEVLFNNNFNQIFQQYVTKYSSKLLSDSTLKPNVSISELSSMLSLLKVEAQNLIAEVLFNTYYFLYYDNNIENTYKKNILNKLYSSIENIIPITSNRNVIYLIQEFSYKYELENITKLFYLKTF